jgi:hypothetical protein
MVQISKIIADEHPYTPYVGPGYIPPDKMAATTNLENTLSVVFGLLTVVGFIYFAIQLIFAGYEFISSSGDAKKLEDARHHLTNGILGLTIVVIAVGAGALFAKIFGIESVFDLNTLLGNMHLN